MLGTILVIVLVLLLIGALPQGPLPISNTWGYGPSGLIGTILVVILILFLLGRV